MDLDPSSRPLVVISHVRWTGVWQRPQQVVSRLARERPVFYVEEPVASPDCPRPRIVSEPAGPVERVWLEVPGEGTVLYGDVRAADYAALLAEWLHHHRSARHDVWLHAPAALDIARSLMPELLVHDVVDDVATA